MGVVERAAIIGVHREVVGAWREIVGQASTMGLADRIVIGVKLKARADALAAYEGLVQDAGDLAGDARRFAAAVRTQNPLAAVSCGIAVAAAGLGFFGWWSVEALKRALTAEAGMAQTTVALIGVLTVAAGAVIIGVVRAAVVAAHAGLQALEIFGVNEHPSAVMLREVRPAEQRLFAVFQQRVPEPPISTVPLLMLAVGGLIAGIVIAALAG